METEKISRRFNIPLIIPGNGNSPYTGCLVFKCFDTVFKRYVTVKASDGIKNVHKTVKEEYEFIRDLKHCGVIKVLDYYEEAGVQYMIMDGLYVGGRRERWRNIFVDFAEERARRFLRLLMDTLKYLHSVDVLHGDIECANIVGSEYRSDDIQRVERSQGKMSFTEYLHRPILIDFGRAEKKEYSWNWFLNQMTLDKKNKFNTFFREITNTGGVYEKEPAHFTFDVKPIIERVLNEYA